MKRAFGFGLAILLSVVGITPVCANLLSDPGFENCSAGLSPPNWSVTNAGSATGAWVCGQNPHSGLWSADQPKGASTLSQTIPTTPGAAYDFSFWLKNGVNGAPNSFAASFDGNQVLVLSDRSNFNYTFEDFKVTASGSSTTISFSALNDGFPAGDWSLDDVSVTPVPAPPIGRGLPVLLAAGGLLFGAKLFERGKHKLQFG